MKPKSALYMYIYIYIYEIINDNEYKRNSWNYDSKYKISASFFFNKHILGQRYEEHYIILTNSTQ